MPMLAQLNIRNFTIIEEMQIELFTGLTVFSGETGAGKSIIVDAINLLCGARATADYIRRGASQAEIEGYFLIDPHSTLADQMRDFGFDPQDNLIVQRILSSNNRHKIIINGRLGTVGMLSNLTGGMISISGQHAHQRLLRRDTHLEMLDQYGELQALVKQVSEVYHRLVPLVEQKKQMTAVHAEQLARVELLEFERHEIESAALEPNEDAALEEEHKRLKHHEQIFQTVQFCIDALYAAPGAIMERLTEVQKALHKVSVYDSRLGEESEKLQDPLFAMEDVNDALRDYLSHLEIDAHRIDAVEQRLDSIRRLCRKYGGSIDAVLTHLENVQQQLNSIETHEETLDQLTRQIDTGRSDLIALSMQLTSERKVKGLALADRITTALQDLRMSETAFEAQFSTIPANSKTDAALQVGDCTIGSNGADRVQFMIAPNVGEELKPLASIASGGELSRVVLAIKAILAQTEAVGTIIFDEVDAGIGGGVAEVVGRKIAMLADYHQVLCITHLPQIAKFGEHHFQIAKKQHNDRTYTSISQLDEASRIEEIARMMAGETLTETTLMHARELIEEARQQVS